MLFNLVRDYKGSEKPDSVEDEKELITNKYFFMKKIHLIFYLILYSSKKLIVNY